jgi:hypothetical protein
MRHLVSRCDEILFIHIFSFIIKLKLDLFNYKNSSTDAVYYCNGT